MSALVSILIPAYNSEQWIADTIKSATNQTWPNVEVIVVDDESTDNTLRVAKQFESKSVKVVSQPNSGATAARNKARSMAQGDYMQWLDHDDILAPDKISKQLNCPDYDHDPQTLLSSTFGTFFYRTSRAKFNPTALWSDLTPIEYFLIKFNEDVWFQTSVWLVSRALSDKAGPWQEIRGPDDDGEYFCRVVAACDSIKFVPEARSYWRVGNPGSLSRSRSDDSMSTLLFSTSLCIDYLMAIEDSERTRSAAVQYLQHRLWYFYPDKHKLLDQVYELAEKLGGKLTEPQENWKFMLLNKVFGWNRTNSIRDLLWNSKVRTRRDWDRLLFALSKR